jgi:hypothetical protein
MYSCLELCFRFALALGGLGLGLGLARIRRPSLKDLTRDQPVCGEAMGLGRLSWSLPLLRVLGEKRGDDGRDGDRLEGLFLHKRLERLVTICGDGSMTMTLNRAEGARGMGEEKEERARRTDVLIDRLLIFRWSAAGGGGSELWKA